mmetsp:Transcript_11124/g.20819  ORF Transcript_11124/g.20819 Transcript_11124/m.20819 type:complete len:84 (+) Transcript_11124:2566-2817(+)
MMETKIQTEKRTAKDVKHKEQDCLAVFVPLLLTPPIPLPQPLLLQETNQIRYHFVWVIIGRTLSKVVALEAVFVRYDDVDDDI